VAIIYGRADSEKQLLDKYPKRVKKIEDIRKVHQELKSELEHHDSKGLVNKIKKWNKKRQVNRFEKNKNNPFHAGADGELRVVDRLSQLSDDYHVLCGINIKLGRWITYNGRKNLRSAQMDFVVVSRRGVILIEVKNWSNQYLNSHRRISPHEQVDRAGRVLWVALKSWRSPKSPRVTNVLLSIQGNIRYDPRYKFVLISDLNKINYFIEKRREEFSDKEVKRLVGRLEVHVTN